MLGNLLREVQNYPFQKLETQNGRLVFIPTCPKNLAQASIFCLRIYVVLYFEDKVWVFSFPSPVVKILYSFLQIRPLLYLLILDLN